MFDNNIWPLQDTLMANKKLWSHLERVPADKLAPAPDKIFTALELTRPEKVKVIILGQDPYIRGEAHGLAFSSQKGITPSLEVIFKELKNEYGEERTNPCLVDWAEQGVLLLNTILTTELGISMEHSTFGWRPFVKEILRYVIHLGNPIVLILWGKKAQDFWVETLKLLDGDLSHIKILSACHPQAENYGSCTFTGCNHFRLANEWLEENNLTPIKWL